MLHEKVRERREPRVSATALAEYLILTADKQDKVLHDCRYTQTSIVAANADAMRALHAYHWDPRRPQDALDRVKAGLMVKAQDMALKPKSRDEAKRCIEVLDLFELRENALGMRRMALSKPPRFEAIDVEGVALSIQPDFMVSGGGQRIGAGILRVAKGPDPEAAKRTATKEGRGEYRREMARYMVAMLQMLLEAQDEVPGIPDRDLCFVADLRIGERIGPAPDHTSRLNAIRGACRQIVKLWPTIEPRPYILKK